MKLEDACFGGGDVKEKIRNKEENLKIHQKKRLAKKVSTTEKVIT